jgi:multiple sugar transport system substrate-binding protein
MLNLRTTAAVSALEEYIRFSRYAYKANRDWGDVASSFVNGSYATTTLYLHYASSFVRTEEAVCNGDIGFAPMPGGNSLLAGGSLGVGKFSDHREEAYEFIKWAAGPEIAPALVMLGGISSSAVVYEQRDILASYPWLSYLAEHIKDGISRPLLSFRSFSHDQTEFEHQLKKNLLAALEGEKTPQEALADAQEYLTSLNA